MRRRPRPHDRSDSAQRGVREAEFDHAGRPTRIALPEDPDYDGTPPVIEGVLTYNARGLPATATLEIDEDPHPIVGSIEYLRDGLVSRIVYGDHEDPDATQSTTVYDVRRRPIRMTTIRTPTGSADLDEVSIVVDQQLAWDPANNLVAIVDHRDPSEWPAGHLPQSTLIRHDGLYRVTHADYEYTQTDGSRSSPDDGTNWRTAFGSAAANDPTRENDRSQGLGETLTT